MQATYRTRTTTLTVDEVLYLADTAEDGTDYYALLSERVYGNLTSGPDASTIAELADGAAPAFQVRYGDADRHVQAQVRYAEGTGIHGADGAPHSLADWSLWNVERTEGFTYHHGLRIRQTRASNGAKTAGVKRPTARKRADGERMSAAERKALSRWRAGARAEGFACEEHGPTLKACTTACRTAALDLTTTPTALVNVNVHAR